MTKRIVRKTLTEANELLLAKYHDDECSILERIKVHRMVDRNPCAVEYLEKLDKGRFLLRKIVPDEQCCLWTRISTRMHQEDRVATLTKKRFALTSNIFSFFRPNLILKYGLSGAFAAATLFYIAPHFQMEIFKNKVPQYLVSSNHSFQAKAPQAVSVDWMRSSGRVTMMQNPDERAPVFFIKRRIAGQSSTLPLIGERNSQGVIFSNTGRIASSSQILDK